jgi:hypothetical protein
MAELKICHWEANSLPETAFGARGAEKGLLSQKSVAEPEEYRGPPTYILRRHPQNRAAPLHAGRPDLIRVVFTFRPTPALVRA